ncbi:MAG: hypothetical protein COW54_15710 [Rhodobacteraceae bacterium CG17_big_fil_post_rev_8_21_14_2_50_63_15]|nr:hypothetical protein [Roseovarius sp.]PIV77208.1 MAG: hypothetical protein COW54_15710 [Rhodobacteraceae bacterium CG17_big_fil_post_rev_8_21_14_2_50_63_15]
MTPRAQIRLRPLPRMSLTGAILGLVLGALLLPAPVAADTGDSPPRTGLLWLSSSLPAVFPLQVRTRAGQDYYLTLIHDETGQATLAAYIVGGDFFRVLVPPGRYELHLASGTHWQDEDRLFGARTRFYKMGAPLLFETRGIGTKAGHIVDLRALDEPTAAVSVSPLAICQRYGADLTGSPLSPPAFVPLTEDPDAPRPRLRFSVRTRVCD